jgi:hypothetical protein
MTTPFSPSIAGQEKGLGGEFREMGRVNFIFTYKGIFERMKANWYDF